MFYRVAVTLSGVCFPVSPQPGARYCNLYEVQKIERAFFYKAVGPIGHEDQKFDAIGVFPILVSIQRGPMSEVIVPSFDSSPQLPTCQVVANSVA